ncbi:hypothetical protein HN873_036804 [Arachis hypogaea]
MADGKFAWAPLYGMLPSGIKEDGNRYRPYFEEGHIDIEEGFGDSEDSIDVISRIASAFEPRLTIVSTFLVPGASIGEVMAKDGNDH